MSSNNDRNEKPSSPRETRIARLNRKPGANKSIIALGIMILLIVLFIIIFMMRRFY
jgi:uncharacterized membrane protein YvbJ